MSAKDAAPRQTHLHAMRDPHDPAVWLVVASDDPNGITISARVVGQHQDEHNAKAFVRAVNLHDELVGSVRRLLGVIHAGAESYDQHPDVLAARALLARSEEADRGDL